MKRALIAIASVGILAPTAWVMGANAQYGSPSPAYRYTPGSGPPPYGVPAQTYARQSEGPWEWHAAPGPTKRGTMCVKHTDATRGYGYHEPCPPPKKGAKK
jgi:hypothetical protein